MGATIARAEQRCAREGARLTPLRREVLEIIASGHEAVGAYDIIERMGTAGDRPAPITVYRALDFLRARGLVHKVESRNAFIVCTQDHAHAQRSLLLICDVCGLVAEREAAGVFDAVEGCARAADFTVNRPIIEVNGTCAQCATAS
ncbi:Fur family zinc uptake transcriptional regulator [Rhodoligotrophos appendicifer]|uniref:transcriptional repressor n=1 Tax=Rhodoligotrophos appendicifer TaxID=987056 RepID=UPI00147855CF|nr:transcriptional repressor [Rhodoligotrophos appendicifer]